MPRVDMAYVFFRSSCLVHSDRVNAHFSARLVIGVVLLTSILLRADEVIQ